jgi:hypothetical protein
VTQQGIPPGYDFKRPKPSASREVETQRENINATFEEIQKSMPGSIRGKPLQYNEEGLLVDDEEEEMARSAASAVADAPPPPPPQTAKPSRSRASRRPMSPLLEKLHKKFGLISEKVYDVDIFVDDATFKFSLTKVPEDIVSWALQRARTRLVTDGDQAATEWFQLLFCCASIVAVDGEPLWQSYSIELNQAEQTQIEQCWSNVPNRVRKITATELSELLWSEIVPIGAKLWEFYEAKVSPKVKSSLDAEIDDLARFVCPIDGCATVEWLKPREDATGAVLPYYCKVHGVQLVETAVSRGTNSPLT